MTNEQPMTPGQAAHRARYPLFSQWGVVPESEKELWEKAALAAIAADPVRKRLAEALEAIFGLSEGWDSDGSTGPKNPLSWETVALMSLDIAHAALAEAEMKTEDV